jgi:hypothetical protein
MTGRHLCAHPDCKLWLPANRFACRSHWRQLPRALRNEINRCFTAHEIEQSHATIEELRFAQDSAREYYDADRS